MNRNSKLKRSSVAKAASTLSLSLAKSTGLNKLLQNQKPACPTCTPKAAAPSKFDSKEWSKAKDNASERLVGFSTCPICLEDLYDGSICLLLCSHVFHKACLSSFERFSSSFLCPCCRQSYTPDSKLTSFDPSLHLRIISAIKIQAAMRGCRARWMVRRALNDVKGLPRNQKRLVLSDRLCGISSKFLTVVQSAQNSIDNLIDQVDKSIMEQRNLLRKALKGSSQIDWARVFLNIFERFNHPLSEFVDVCPICLVDFKVAVSFDSSNHCQLTSADCNRSISITDCGHLIHSCCISAFEKFSCNSFNCPVCRALYERIDV
ncbi:hypothetical protein RCL1_002911 [Eukaryota sp. TZLM3-RCL]